MLLRPASHASGVERLSIAQANLWNLFDDVGDPATGDVLTPEQYAIKLHKTANAIVEMGLPDVLSVNEIEGANVLRDLLAQPQLAAAGYAYVVEPSNDERGINVGVLYKAGLLEPVAITQPNPVMSFRDKGAGFIDRTRLFARPPLVVDFKLRGAAQAAEGAGLLTIAVNHFKSKTGGPLWDARREMQGQFLGEWLDAKRAVEPAGATIVLGDLNASHGEPLLEKLIKRADGSKRFHDAPLALAPEDRYTYIYRGQKDLLDHIMVPAGREDAVAGVRILHLNSAPNAAKKHQWDRDVVTGYSDHDPMIVDLDLSRLLSPRS